MMNSNYRMKVSINNFVLLIKIMYVSILVFLIGCGSSFAGEPDCCERQFLFNIERTRDADEVYYYVKLNQDGSLHMDKPVNVYWMKFTQDGRQEPLTWMQRKYAYGLRIIDRGLEKVVFQFVSYDKLSFVVKRDSDGIFRVYLENSHYDLQVKSIRVYFASGTLMIPSVEKVELQTLHAGTGRLMVQSIRPGK